MNYTTFPPHRICVTPSHEHLIELNTLQQIQEQKLSGTFNFIITLTKEILICEDTEKLTSNCSLLPQERFEKIKANNHSHLYATGTFEPKKIIGFGELIFSQGIFKKINNISGGMRKPNMQMAQANIGQSIKILDEVIDVNNIEVEMRYICYEKECKNNRSLHRDDNPYAHTIDNLVVSKQENQIIIKNS